MQTINLEPTWVQTISFLLAVIKDGTAEGRKLATDEMMELAKNVDALNVNAKAVRESARGKKVKYLEDTGATEAGVVMRKGDQLAIVTNEGRVEWFKLNQFGGILPSDKLIEALVAALEDMLSIDDWHDDSIADPQMIANAKAVLAMGKEAVRS